jgi:hypothetical protein
MLCLLSLASTMGHGRSYSQKMIIGVGIFNNSILAAWFEEF